MKTKISTLDKVYAVTKKMFKVGVELPISKIAKYVKISTETARINIMKLQAQGKVKRDKAGHIINVK